MVIPAGVRKGRRIVHLLGAVGLFVGRFTASATVSFAEEPIDQTIVFTAPSAGAVGESATLIATGGESGNPVVFTVDGSSDVGVCTVSGTDGATVNYAAVGTCVIDANQAGDANYSAAPEVQRSITVGQGSQVITLTVPLPESGRDGRRSYLDRRRHRWRLGQPGDLPRRVQRGHLRGVGRHRQLHRRGSLHHPGGSGGRRELLAWGCLLCDRLGPGSQTITFVALADRTLAESPFTVSATASSGLPVTFTTTTPTVCTAIGTSVTLATTGTCTIRAEQAGDPNFSVASPVDTKLQRDNRLCSIRRSRSLPCRSADWRSRPLPSAPLRARVSRSPSPPRPRPSAPPAVWTARPSPSSPRESAR